jgi:hypothetical protein
MESIMKRMISSGAEKTRAFDLSGCVQYDLRYHGGKAVCASDAAASMH